jgi:hypothetical protein
VLRTVTARIRRWYWGKLAILWAWGGLVVALLLTAFLSQRVDEANWSVSSFTFLASLAILAALTVVTWIWLGGKDRPEA